MDLSRFLEPLRAPDGGPAPFATPPAANVAHPALLVLDAPAPAAIAPLEVAPAPIVPEAPIVPVEPTVAQPKPGDDAAISAAAAALQQESERPLISAAPGKPVSGSPSETPAPAAGDPASAAPAAKAVVEAQPPVPIKYQAFKVPHGTTFDEAKLKAEFSDLIAPFGVTQDVAQKLVDNLVKEIDRAVTATRGESREYFNGLVAKWKAEATKDLKLRNRYDTAIANGKGLIRNYAASPEDAAAIFQQLALNGMGNFPPYVRFADRLGDLLNVQDGADAPPASSATPPKSAKSGRGWYGGLDSGNPAKL